VRPGSLTVSHDISVIRRLVLIVMIHVRITNYLHWYLAHVRASAELASRLRLLCPQVSVSDVRSQYTQAPVHRGRRFRAAYRCTSIQSRSWRWRKPSYGRLAAAATSPEHCRKHVAEWIGRLLTGRRKPKVERRDLLEHLQNTSLILASDRKRWQRGKTALT
jgi:hypothetical protein